jgi:replicative DNA helicase
MSEREIPNFDLDLERAMASEAVFTFDRFLAHGLAVHDFESTECRHVVEAAHAAWEAGESGIEGVTKALQRQERLRAVGGRQGLMELIAESGAPDADRFRELVRLRRLEASALEVMRKARAGDLAGALEGLTDAHRSAVDGAATVRPLDAVDLGGKLLEALVAGSREQRLIHPGMEIMAEVTGGFLVGSMVILGGGTNVGKSSVCLELMMCAAERNVASGYVSLEDPEDVLSARLLGAQAGISSWRLSSGKLDRDDFGKLGRDGIEPLRRVRRNLWFSFCVGGSEIDVCAAMSRLAMQGCKIVIVDYVQAIESSKRQQDRRNEIRWLSARIKAHAQRLGVVLVLVSQLSRPPKGDEFKEPTKHDLKEAGDLENAAELVLLLWRGNNDDMEPINVKIEKSKMGGNGSRWMMARDPKTFRLREVDGSLMSGRRGKR